MKPDNIKIIPQWSKSKEDIWNEAFASLEDTPSSKKKPAYPILEICSRAPCCHYPDRVCNLSILYRDRNCETGIASCCHPS